MPATISDVAKRAKVSMGTVSNVLNGRAGQYGPATLERVTEAIQHLGYHPNRAARNLRRQTARAIGVSFVDERSSLRENPYSAEILDGVMSVAGEQGYDVLVFTRRQPDYEAQHVLELMDRRIDGLCLVAPDEGSPLLQLLPTTGLRFVVTGAEYPGTSVNWVDVDNAAGARLAMEHLLELGHTRIAHIAGSRGQRAARVRARVYVESMQASGLTSEADWLVWCDFDFEQARQAARDMLERPARPSAIFAANDLTALGALASARDLGIDVPGDLSIVGFDDIAEAHLLSPGLTTVRQPVYDIGRIAASWLITPVDGECSLPLQQRVAPALVQRETTCRVTVGRLSVAAVPTTPDRTAGAKGN